MFASFMEYWRLGLKKVTVLTGAGMSTESGLPDFRSQQGLWRERPESLATLEALHRQPCDFYFFYQWRIARLWEATPNAGHLVLAELMEKGCISGLITQNVDGLHQRSGIKGVAELHGTLRTVSCIRCQKSYDSRKLIEGVTVEEDLYRRGKYQPGAECSCSVCGGQLRPDVVLFGEGLPPDVWEKSCCWAEGADLFIVIGSSLAVSPANYLPRLALEKGARLLIINQEPTILDPMASWVWRGAASESLKVMAEMIM